MEEDVASSMLYVVVQLSKSSYQQKKDLHWIKIFLFLVYITLFI